MKRTVFGVLVMGSLVGLGSVGVYYAQGKLAPKAPTTAAADRSRNHDARNRQPQPIPVSRQPAAPLPLIPIPRKRPNRWRRRQIATRPKTIRRQPSRRQHPWPPMKFLPLMRPRCTKCRRPPPWNQPTSDIPDADIPDADQPVAAAPSAGPFAVRERVLADNQPTVPAMPNNQSGLKRSKRPPLPLRPQLQGRPQSQGRQSPPNRDALARLLLSQMP